MTDDRPGERVSSLLMHGAHCSAVYVDSRIPRVHHCGLHRSHATAGLRMKRKITKLREEARQCVHVADQTTDNKVAAALLAYACELEQRARLIESAKKQKKPDRPLSGDRATIRLV
jgi:hypothetical protein